jgi:two-component system phosphate regulon sensor histidine kinase PhoR
MPDPVDACPNHSTESIVRRAAIRGAFLASALMVAVAAARDHLDGWMLGGAITAVTLSALLIADRDRVRTVRIEDARNRREEGGLAKALFEDLPDPVLLVNRRSVVVDANRAAHTLLPPLRLQHPLSFALRSPDVLGAVEAVFRTGEGQRVEYVERVPTERAFDVQISAVRAGDPEQLPSVAALYFRDLTEARRLEHMRVDFVANASHELRTPLATLMGFIETLQGPARNDVAARERFLEIMRGQAQRMTRLIDDLLSLSRIEMWAHMPPQTPVELQPILRHIVETLTPLARERGVEIRLDLAPETLRVLGDRDELARVVDNLVENAVKYGDRGGFVDVTLAHVGGAPGAEGEVQLGVRDYGAGIAPEHLPRLTERFYRADVAQSRDKGGTGLGLAIVKHIVNRHRGRLAIESRLGEGALFTVSLPEYQPREDSPPER